MRRDVLDEAVDDPDRVLERVPARDLQDVGRRRAQGASPRSSRRALDPRLRPVLALELRLRVRLGLDEPGGGEDRGDDLVGELLVLRGEGVDRRRDDVHALPLEVLPDELLAREQAGVGLLDPFAQEGPGLARGVVGRVEPDVAAPDHRRAGRLQARDQPGGLRVVQHDDVAVGDGVAERVAAGLERGEVGLALLVAERAAVALGAVQLVVEALGDLEEALVALDHRPASVDAGAARVGQQRGQHLGHAAAAGGRVDVPDHAAVEELRGLADRLLDLRVLLVGEDRREAVHAVLAGVDDRECAHRADGPTREAGVARLAGALVGFPSGQRGRAVNPLAQPSQVRILPPPCRRRSLGGAPASSRSPKTWRGGVTDRLRRGRCCRCANSVARSRPKRFSTMTAKLAPVTYLSGVLTNTPDERGQLVVLANTSTGGSVALLLNVN